MSRSFKLSALSFIVLFGISGVPASSHAAASDYRFDVLNQPVKAGQAASFSVRLTQVPTGKPVVDAVIVGQKLHMIMGGMDMPLPVKTLPSDEKGSYRFSADLTMYGEWTLDLTAKVTGEPQPIQTSVKVQVVK